MTGIRSWMSATSSLQSVVMIAKVRIHSPEAGGRFIGRGDASKKEGAHRPGAAAPRFCNLLHIPHRLRVEQYTGKSLKFHRDNARNLSLFAPENAISA